MITWPPTLNFIDNQPKDVFEELSITSFIARLPPIIYKPTFQTTFYCIEIIPQPR